MSWMTPAGWLTIEPLSDSSWLKVSAVTTGGLCFDLPWILALDLNEDYRWFLCSTVLLQPNRFHSCRYPVPKVVPLRFPCIGNFKFDRRLTWPDFACRGQTCHPSWECSWFAKIFKCIDGYGWIMMNDECRSFPKMCESSSDVFGQHGLPQECCLFSQKYAAIVVWSKCPKTLNLSDWKLWFQHQATLGSDCFITTVVCKNHRFSLNVEAAQF